MMSGVKLRIKNETYKIVIPKRKYMGMMFMNWKYFDAMFFNTHAREITTHFCPKMRIAFIKNNKVTKTMIVKPWKTLETDHIPHDYIIEMSPKIDLTTGDKISIR